MANSLLVCLTFDWSQEELFFKLAQETAIGVQC